MEIALTLLASIGTAYLAAHTGRHARFTRADLLIGLFAGIASAGMARLLSADGAEWGAGLPIFFGCALALGLESLQRRSVWR